MDDSKPPEQPPKWRPERRTRATLRGIAAEAPLSDEVDPADEEEGVTLEELSQSYQRVLADVDSSTALPNGTSAADSSTLPSAQPLQSSEVALEGSQFRDLGTDGDLSSVAQGVTNQQSAESAPRKDAEQDTEGDTDEGAEHDEDNAACPLTPQSIVEAILFVGRPDGIPIPAAEIAGLMRGVDASEVATCVEQLNDTYAQTNRATRIVVEGAGYRMQLAENVSFIRDRFYGRVRQVKLNQAAVDCLALIAYQPGISREKLEQQRGQPSGSLLSQMIRRQLIEMRRVTEAQKSVQRYYPTNRLLDLTGIESLDDLPQTEDLD